MTKPKQNYKTRMPTITTFLQHYTEGPRQCGKTGGKKGVRKEETKLSVLAKDKFVYLKFLKKKIYQ